MKTTKKHRTTQARTVGELALCAVVLSLCLSGVAQATTISLGEAGLFTALALNNCFVFMGNDPTKVTGDMGIAAGSQGLLDKGTVTGTTFVDPLATVTTGGSWNGTIVNQSLAQAVSHAVAASLAFGGLTANQPNTSLATTTTLNGLSGDNIYLLTGGVNLNSKTLTLNGPADAYFIFNDPDGFFFSSSSIALTGGVTANHVLFNLTGSTAGVEAGLRNSGTFRGTLLAPNRAIQADHLTIEGALIGGRDSTFNTLDKDGASFSLHSEVQVVPKLFQPAPIPDASTILLACFGALQLLAIRKKVFR